MPRIREQTVYTIQELTGEARSRALQKLAEWNTSHDWWDYTVDDAKRMGAILGIQIDDVRFSGFSSQGDGASFVGSYRYANGSRKAIRREAPQDTELHRIADKLADIERRNFYRLTATVTERRGAHYAHEYTVDVETDDGRDDDTGDKGTLAVRFETLCGGSTSSSNRNMNIRPRNKRASNQRTQMNMSLTKAGALCEITRIRKIDS